MPLLSLRDVSFTYGGESLLEHLNLEIDRGEKIGLLGRNGAGKSTLMKIIAGEIELDVGTLQRAPQVRIARLIQEVPKATGERTVAQLVAEGYDTSDESVNDWEVEQAVAKVLSRVELDGEQQFATLSSGMKRRVLLAKALVHEPDILLLDEPTNHLDIESITWLEGFLKNYDGALLFVTHDRTFLQQLADRILEIDRGHLFDWTCDYDTFLVRKQQQLDAEEKQNELFDRKLAEEEVWIRKGIKARRTRNEGRVRALKKMRQERAERRQQLGDVRMQAGEAEKSGRLVIEMKNVSFSYDEKPVIKDYSTLLTRGDKVGIIGRNGAGKSTLLKLILGKLQPTSGTVRQGTRLQIIYFDQLREQIDDEKTVIENVGEGEQTLTINGATKNIYGYLQDFLFTPERARLTAKALSGGERNRLLLARLFKNPSNLLVLDEPTNDLDAETLDLLEELVVEYMGTVLLVSHDRTFLNNVVTSTIHVRGDGSVKEYDGGYDDFVRQSQSQPSNNTKQSASADKTKPKKAAAQKNNNKLSYKERRELEAAPQRIEELETEQSELHTMMADPAFFKKPSEEISKATKRLEELTGELEILYERWEELAARE